MLAGGAVMSTAPLFAGSTAKRRSRKRGSAKKLLVIFQRGGNDSLNTMVPREIGQYNLYTGLRPNLSINRSDLMQMSNSDGFFGLHPGLAPLVPIIESGNMTMIHAVGYPGADRSHFESQSYYETGVPGMGLLGGWLNRYLENTSGAGLIRGISVGYNIPQSVAGTVAVPVSSNFGNSQVAVDPNLNSSEADAYRAILDSVYDLTPSAGNDALYDTGDKIFQMIQSFADRNLNNYVPENGAVYPTTGFGNRIRHAAQMLKEDPSPLGVEICAIDQYGFDTHSNQVIQGNPSATTSGHGFLMADLAGGLSAFYTDMGSRMGDTMVLVISEFGRRAYQNDSFGTDHGTGSIAMVMGGGGLATPTVNSAGAWPGLENGNLKDGGDLDWATDFRDIYWEILAGHFGLDNATMDMIIPGHTYTPVGFM
jgi:uncharacterized protein (DUF1501 family)